MCRTYHEHLTTYSALTELNRYWARRMSLHRHHEPLATRKWSLTYVLLCSLAIVCLLRVRVQENVGSKPPINGPYFRAQDWTQDRGRLEVWFLKLGRVLSWVRTYKIWWGIGGTLVPLHFSHILDSALSVNSLHPTFYGRSTLDPIIFAQFWNFFGNGL